MIRLFFVGLVLLSFGCATTHTGVSAESPDKSVILSVDRLAELSDKYYSFYEYTIENKSSEWKQVQVVDMDFAGQETEVLTDDKLSAWIEGAELKQKKSQYNKDLLLGSMVAIGGITAMTSSNTNVQTLGVATMGAGAIGSVATSISRAKQQATSGIRGQNNTVSVPATHVFVPTKIAPESYVKRWVVLRSPKPTKEQIKKSGRDFADRTSVTFELDSKVAIDNAAPISFKISPYPYKQQL